VGAAAVVIVACRQIVGIADDPPGAGAAPVCGGLPWAEGECAACMLSSCCTEATKCASEPACASTFGCVARCAPGDEACRSKCVVRGDEAMAAVGACQSRACAPDCGLKCGGWGLLAGPQLAHIESTPGCESCLTSTACNELANCVAHEACLAARFCNNACIQFDGQCVTGCGAPPIDLASPYAVDAGSVLSDQELLTYCAAECQPGTDWSCVGHAAWPSPRAPAITLRIRFEDAETTQPLKGVSGQACAYPDMACSPPIAQGTSGADGIVTFSDVPVQLSPFTGYFHFTLAGYLPTDVVVTPFLAESSSASPAQVATLPMLTMLDNQQLFIQAQIPYDPTLGTILIYPVDCEGIGAPGVSFNGTNLGPKAVPYYVVNGLPTTSVSATVAGPLQPTGGLANVTPGPVRIDAYVGGKIYGTVNARVSAGGIAYAVLVPAAQ
jgi:hypothetical protein